jgi:flagellin
MSDLTRINTNVQSLQSLQALQRTNSELSLRQMRLATGSRINRAEDDSAGYSIAAKLQARVRGQAQALANVGDAKSMLTVAEGSLNTIMDILQTMKEKVVQAANDTLGSDERTAIENQLTALSSEIGEIISDTKFNGKSLLSAGTLNFSFQVNAESGDTFSVAMASISVASLGVSVASLAVGSAASAALALTSIDGAITDVATILGSIGDSQSRLTFKMENLNTAMVNYESARSRIADADFAREQMEVVKLQILQQTGTAALAQSNVAPQTVLSLF